MHIRSATLWTWTIHGFPLSVFTEYSIQNRILFSISNLGWLTCREPCRQTWHHGWCIIWSKMHHVPPWLPPQPESSRTRRRSSLAIVSRMLPLSRQMKKGFSSYLLRHLASMPAFSSYITLRVRVCTYAWLWHRVAFANGKAALTTGEELGNAVTRRLVKRTSIILLRYTWQFFV